MPNITTHHAITYTNSIDNIKKWKALEITIIHGATRVTVISIVMGALETISENANVYHRRLSLPDMFGTAQLSARYPWYCSYLAESVAYLSSEKLLRRD